MPTQVSYRSIPWGLPRRLPVVPLPLAGESFFSWVDHLAHTYEVHRGPMMHALGLVQTAPQWAARDLIRYTMQLPAQASRVVESATGLTARELALMTLEDIGPPYTGISASRMPKETWAFCPKCLAPGGRWPLWWYEPWAVACPVHRCYLVSFCPHCDTPFTPERTSSRWGSALRCRGFRDPYPHLLPPGTRREHCGITLSEIDTTPVSDPVVLDAVNHLRHGLTSRARPRAWLSTYHVLNALFDRPVFEVRSFNSPDPVLQRRYSPQRATAPGYTVDSSGFLEPGRTLSDGTHLTYRDPITRACRLSVLGRILGSRDMSATAQKLLEIRRRVRMRHYLTAYRSPDPRAASARLHRFLDDVFGPGEFATLKRSRRTLTPEHHPGPSSSNFISRRPFPYRRQLRLPPSRIDQAEQDPHAAAALDR
ncbi:TniQ family protein [Streptomyces sp. NPDC006285]|uniref:TniQ family protein n=1 Tax=Streptomyces sp. NPDC006285 TaxID=3364742 RepID=UPI0036CA1995